MVVYKDWEGSQLFELKNDSFYITLVSYGARMNEFVYEGKDLTIGYESIQSIRKSAFYTNSIVGRFANRIENGRFILNGTKYQLDQNEKGVTHLHGGSSGFSRVEWQGEIAGDNSVRFTRLSPHMEMGYPGNLILSVTYSLEEDGLVLEYRAMCDRDTILNISNHTYFNLDGYTGRDCREMEMRLSAPYYLPVNNLLIPTGKPAPVDGTNFDFRSWRPIRDEYDHCFVFDKGREYSLMAELYSPSSKIGLNIFTDLPALQLYTGTYLNDPGGKGKQPIHPHQAITLETQFLPDSPNHKEYPSTVLKGGEVFYSKTKYGFWRK